MRYDIKSTVPPPASQTTKQSPTWWGKQRIGDMSVKDYTYVEWLLCIPTLYIYMCFIPPPSAYLINISASVNGSCEHYMLDAVVLVLR